MSELKSTEIFQIIDGILKDRSNEITVKELCETAGVSRQGYYKRRKSELNRINKELKDNEDFALILQAFEYRGYDKGARGIYMRLAKMGVNMNLKKIRRLMKKFNLHCPIRKANTYRRMAKAMKTNNYASNILSRNFEAYGARAVLLTDISYIPYNGIFAYLSVIIDAYTKEVLAYVLSPSLEVDFVLKTVEILMKNHKDELKSDALIHSDQGCHYTSHRFIKIIEDSELRRSMSRRGNCRDNAPQESFFGHMKDEIILKIKRCTEFRQVQSIIDDRMDYYNNDRCVWSLNKMAPREFYESLKSGANPLGD